MLTIPLGFPRPHSTSWSRYTLSFPLFLILRTILGPTRRIQPRHKNPITRENGWRSRMLQLWWLCVVFSSCCVVVVVPPSSTFVGRRDVVPCRVAAVLTCPRPLCFFSRHIGYILSLVLSDHRFPTSTCPFFSTPSFFSILLSSHVSCRLSSSLRVVRC